VPPLPAEIPADAAGAGRGRDRPSHKKEEDPARGSIQTVRRDPSSSSGPAAPHQRSGRQSESAARAIRF